MKAQARKILALIMAMVMSLSLAAPAFAEAEEAAEASAPAPEAVEVVEAEAPEAPEAEEEEEEPEAEAQETKAEKKSDKKLKAQSEQTSPASGAVNNHLLRYDDQTGSYTIEDTSTNPATVLASGKLTDSTQANSNVKVTLVGSPDWIINYAATPTYNVKYGSDDLGDVEIGTASTTRKTLADVDWRELSGAETVFEHTAATTTPPAAAIYAQVKGSVYEEKLPNGASNVYFKLFVGNTGNTAFTSNEQTYVATSVAPLNGDSDVVNALTKAKQCNEFGDTTVGTMGGLVKATGAYVIVESEPTAPTSYVFAVMNEVDTTVTAATAITACTLDTGKTTGSFQVSIHNESFNKPADFYYVSSQTEAQEILEKQFAENNITGVAIESVTGPVGNSNYWTVTVKKVEGAKPAAAGWSKNVVNYQTGTKNVGTSSSPVYVPVYTAVLINDAKDGFYNGNDKKGADGEAISAGKNTLGPVAVRVADIPSAVKTNSAAGNTLSVLTTEYTNASTSHIHMYNNGTAISATPTWGTIDTIVFDSIADTKNVFKVATCDQGATVPYVQLKMNAVVGGHVNPFVTVKKNSFAVQTVGTAFSYTPTSSSAETATLDNMATLADTELYFTDTAWAASETDPRVMYTVEPNLVSTGATKNWFADAFTSTYASYVEKGSVSVEAASHGAIVERVDIVDPTCQAKGSKTTIKSCSKCGTIMSQKVEEIPAITDPVEKNKAQDPTDATKKKVVFDADDVKAGSTTGPSTKHYVAKAEKVTTLSDDKMTTTVTTTYTCNFGFVHDELTTTESTTKTELQHAGRWNHISLDKKTALDTSDDFWSMLKSVTIADSDIDNANIPMNRTAEYTKDGKPDTVIYTELGSGVTNWTYANGAYSAVVIPGTVTVTAGTTTYTKATDGVGIYTSSTGVPATKYYAAVVTVSDVKLPQYKHQDTTNTRFCDDGSCVVGVTVYEVKGEATNKADGFNGPTSYDSAVTGSNLTNNLKNGKVVVVNDSFKETVTLTGSGHKYFNDDGVATELCTHCGTKRETEAPVSNVIDPANVTVKNMTWTGKVAQPKVTVKDADGFTLIKGTDYVVSEVDGTDVGEYSVTIKGINEYAGNKFTKTFKINKAKATLKKKSAPSTLTANKNKAVTGQIKMTVTGGKVAKYKVTGKVAGVSVNKSGKITVKKANKKAGTLKVKVTMTPDANHTAAKAVTVKVAIKAAKK